MSKVTKISDFSVFDELFKTYQNELNEFIEKNEELEIDKKMRNGKQN